MKTETLNWYRCPEIGRWGYDGDGQDDFPELGIRNIDQTSRTLDSSRR
jgi:hypothetical protein